MLPVYVFTVLGLVLLLVVFCIIYYRIYKYNINRVLEDPTYMHKPMPAPFHVAIVATIIFLIFAIGISFAVGFGMGYRALDDDGKGQIDVNTIYAQIKDIEENVTSVESMMTVDTIELNYEPYYKELTFRLYEGLMIERNDQPISLSDLQAGDFVSIVLLTDLGGVEDIIKIELLDGEQ